MNSCPAATSGGLIFLNIDRWMQKALIFPGVLALLSLRGIQRGFFRHLALLLF